MHARRSLAVLLLTALSFGAFCRPAGAVTVAPRYGHTATLLADGNILVVGGQTDDTPTIVNGVNSVQLTDEQGGAINNRNSAAPYVARTSHTATLMPNGEVLIAGGWDNAASAGHDSGNVNKSVVIYNPVQNCWRAAINFTQGVNGRFNHTATLLQTGDVLICGGQTGAAGNPTDGTCDLFHPTMPPALGAPVNTLDACAGTGGTMDATGVALLVPRALHSATLLNDGRVFLTGGLEPNPGAPRSLKPYMVTSETFTPGSTVTGSAAPLNVARAYHRASLLGNGKVLIVGGYNGANPGGDLNANRGYLDSTEIYDSLSDRMTIGGQIPMRISQQGQVTNGDGTVTTSQGLGNITTTYFNASGLVNGPFSHLTGAYAPSNVLSTMNVVGGSVVTIQVDLTLPIPVTGRISDGFILFSSPSVTFPGGIAYLTPGAENNGVLSGAFGLLNGVNVGCTPGACGVLFPSPQVAMNNPGGQYYATPGPGVTGGIATLDNTQATAVQHSTADWSPHGLTSQGTSAGTLNYSSIFSGDVIVSGIPKAFIGGAISSAALTATAGTIQLENGSAQLLETISLSQGMGRFSAFTSNIVADPVTGLGQFTGHIMITQVSGAVVCATNLVDDPPGGGYDLDSKPLTALGGQLLFSSTHVDLSDPSVSFKVDVATVVIRQMAFGDTLKYSPQTNAWAFKDHSPDGNDNLFGGTATLEPSASIRRLGGRRCTGPPGSTCATFPAMGPATNDVSADDGAIIEQLAAFSSVGAAMGSVRTNHTSTLLPSGQILIAGGSNGPNVLPTADLFDPATQIVTPTGSMNVARDLHTATLLPNGRVLVTGGFATTALSTGPSATAEIFYPNINRWVLTASMPTPADNHTAILLPNGNVLVAGGFANGVYLSKAQIYISTAGIWQALPDMNDGVALANKIPRALHTATLMQDGRVLITGGINQTGVLCSSVIFDINYTGATWPWTTGTNIGSPSCLAVHSHSATLLKSGRVLVTGGTDGVSEVDNTLIYTPTPTNNPDNNSAVGAGTWVVVPLGRRLNIKRFGHAAMLAPNGKVFIMGGAKSLGNAVQDVETFDAGVSSFQIVGQLNKARISQSSTIGADGFIYAFGGTDGISPQASIERNYFTGFPDGSSLGVAPGTRQSIISKVDVMPFQGINAVSGNNFTVMVASNTSNGPFVTITGTNLLGLGESAGGGAGSGNSSFHGPRFILQQAGGSGGTTSQNAGDFSLDLSTRVYFPTDANNWTKAITSMTIQMPNWDSTVNTSPGLGGGMLPYGWYHLRAYANSVYSNSLMVQVGPPLPPAPLITSSATVLGVSSITWSWTVNPITLPSDRYDAFAVYAASSGVLITSLPKSLNPSFTQTSLSANTTGCLMIAAYNTSGDGPLLFSNTFYTLSSTAAFNTINSSPAFTSVGFNTLTLTWDPNGNLPGTVYEIYQSTDDFVLNVTTPIPTILQQTSTSAVINFLLPNIKYGFKIRAFNGNGLPSAYSVEVSTPTRAPVANVVGSAINSTSIQWTWVDPGGVLHFNVYTTTHGLITSVPGATFNDIGLSTNTQRAIMVTAVTGSGEGPLSPAATAYTLAAPPVALNPSIINLTTGSFSAAWSANQNPLATSYHMEVLDGTGADLADVVTANFNSGFGGFPQAGSPFSVKVEALNGDGISSGFTLLGSSATTAIAPLTLTIVATTLSSISVGWSNGVNSSTVTYEVSFSTDNFATDVKYAVPFSAKQVINTATIGSLLTNATYGIQVQAMNSIGAKTAFSNRVTTSPFNGGVVFGSLGIAIIHDQTTTLTGTIGTVGAPRLLTVNIPANTFPLDTFVTISTVDLSGPNSACGGGVNVGLSITPSPYIQPVRPFFVTFAYTNAELGAIPTTQAALERVDPAGTCVPLNTTVDTANHLITAQMNHLSTFQLANVAPSTDPDSTVVFPNPFMPNQGNGFVTFKNMPAASRVRIFTLRGELVFDGTSNGSGLLTWGGTNLFGRNVASGVYLSTVEFGSKKKILKLVVLR